MAQLPPLGLAVYQLVEAESPETVKADYTIFTRGRSKITSNAVFYVNELDDIVRDLTLENSYLQLGFSQTSGLLEVMSLQ